MERLIEVEPEGSVIWRGLALSFHISCRVSEHWAYSSNGLVPPDFRLTKRDLVFVAGDFQLPREDRKTACLVQSTSDIPSVEVRQRLVAIMTRIRAVLGNERVGGGKSNGALENMLDILDIYLQLDG